MKKIILSILIIIYLIPIVNAASNRLIFTSNKDRLIYNTSYFNENIFMHHTDMIPGSSYKDELIIENKTTTKYKLYLRVVDKNQSILSNELLDNIEMSIYLNGNLIYDGYARGLDYKSSGVNLQNSIYIGEYSSLVTSELLVETKLNTSYSNTNNNEFAYIDWEFVANYNDEIIPINPDTGDRIFIIIKILLTLLIGISIMLYIMYRKMKYLV